MSRDFSVSADRFIMYVEVSGIDVVMPIERKWKTFPFESSLRDLVAIKINI